MQKYHSTDIPLSKACLFLMTYQANSKFKFKYRPSVDNIITLPHSDYEEVVGNCHNPC